jgi:hypothetical protein
MRKPKPFVIPEEFCGFLRSTLIPKLESGEGFEGYETQDVIEATCNKIHQFRFLCNVYFKHDVPSNEWLSVEGFSALTSDKQAGYRHTYMTHVNRNDTVSFPKNTYIKGSIVDSDRFQECINKSNYRIQEFFEATTQLLLEGLTPSNQVASGYSFNDLFTACFVTEENGYYPDTFEQILESDAFANKPIAKMGLFLRICNQKAWMGEAFGHGKQSDFAKGLSDLFIKHITKPHGLFIHGTYDRYGDHHYGENKDANLLFNPHGIEGLPPITFFSTDTRPLYSKGGNFPPFQSLPALNEMMVVPLLPENNDYRFEVDRLLRRVATLDAIPGQYKGMANKTLAQIHPKKVPRPTAMGS